MRSTVVGRRAFSGKAAKGFAKHGVAEDRNGDRVERDVSRQLGVKRAVKVKYATNWMCHRVVVPMVLMRGKDRFPREEAMTIHQSHKKNVRYENDYYARLKKDESNPGALWRWRISDYGKYQTLRRRIRMLAIEHPLGENPEEFQHHYDVLRQAARDAGYEVSENACV